MAVLTRITDFVPNTLIKSQEVDDELNQLVKLLSGVSTDKDALLKFSDGTNPVLRVDQLGAGVIQQWLQNGSVKSRINNNGSFESIAGPALAASQLIAAPLTIDGTTDIVLKANGFIVGYPKTIRIDSSTANSSGAGPDVLHTFTLPANILAANDDYLDVYYSGTFAANDNNKAVQARFAGQTYENSGAVDVDGGAWVMCVKILRLSSTSVRVTSHTTYFGISIDSANVLTSFGGTQYIVRQADLTGLSDLGSNTQVMDVRSLGVAGSDVSQKKSIIAACQMS
jgi:hypothetical protein